MIKVLSAPLQDDLQPFADFLWRYQIPHRILEADQEQQLWVGRSVNAEQICKLYDMWRGGLDLDTVQVEQQQHIPAWRDRIGECWLTCALIGCSLLLSFLTGFGDNWDLTGRFTIAAVVVGDGSLYADTLLSSLASFEIWRLLTPMFLHFSLPHLLFNLLWVWVVGSRIERSQGVWALLGLVTTSALLANVAQYLVSGPLFGGMSGVVFGLLGYAWLWDRKYPANPVGLPPALMGFMLFWLALGYTGALEAMGFGSIANTAHLAGLVAGLFFVPIGRLISR
ncbi:rhomboid family intramembrane serine protease [Marinobacterium jannaschii]|uniref:rhomboid family intramembrane serine protease n=1 Tax=Marinobacterium jannaschii TaxID=64970 RepID=UPI0004834DF0|nr:rhomboid family intramembrane serine protease [Marinobacterium jannaschii]